MTAGPRFAPPPIATGTALFLDFDGTLADIQYDPDTVALDAAASDALLALSDRLGGALAILSGRDVRDLARRLPERLWRVGGHGIEVCGPDEPPGSAADTPAALLAAVDRLAARHPGVRVERKGPLLALHYRAAPELGPALAAELQAIVSDIEDYRLQGGKMVIELKPRGADKGEAMAALMRRPPFAGRIPVMAGDDATDEDGFAVAQSLGGFGVKVGEGATVADFRLPAVAAVWRWLETAEAE